MLHGGRCGSDWAKKPRCSCTGSSIVPSSQSASFSDKVIETAKWDCNQKVYKSFVARLCLSFSWEELVQRGWQNTGKWLKFCREMLLVHLLAICMAIKAHVTSSWREMPSLDSNIIKTQQIIQCTLTVCTAPLSKNYQWSVHIEHTCMQVKICALINQLLLFVIDEKFEICIHQTA